MLNTGARLFVAAFSLLAISQLTSWLAPPTRAAQRKDYLSAIEADKIRDAETENERITLFLTFAADRLKKFQYELDHPSPNHHAEMLNSLLNAYVGCVDDAADRVELGVDKQLNIRTGIELLIKRGQEFLLVLQKLSSSGSERELYKDNLDDAIEGTQDAVHDAEAARKEVAPPPERRR